MSENHERERIIIESSILAVTLLFIVVSLRGVTEDASAILTLSAVSLSFAISSIFATMNMFVEFPRFQQGPMAWGVFGFFTTGLVGLASILAGIAFYETGAVTLHDAMQAVDLFCIATFFGTIYIAYHWRGQDRTK